MRTSIMVALSVCFAVPVTAAEFERTISAAGVRQVTIALSSGDVTVIGTKDKNIRVTGDNDPSVEVDSKQVTIGTFDAENPPNTPEGVKRWQATADVEVSMPAGIDLTVRTLAGEVTVKRVAGRVNLTVISGDVDVVDCIGPLDIQAVSGDINIRGLAADLSAKSVSGEVSIRGFDALLLEAKSVSGTVEVRDAKARTVRLTTHSGDLLYAGQTPADGSVELTTFSGNAVVELPSGSGFEIDATTFSGTVSVSIPVEISKKTERRLRGRTSQPGPRLRLKSHSGDVSVK